MAANDTRVDVCLQSWEASKVPQCPHGPTLLFERFTAGSSVGKRFYACSACRDRRECSFFQWEDAAVSAAAQKARQDNNKRQQPRFTHSQLYQRKETFVCLAEEDQQMCEDCGLLLLPDDITHHNDHKLTKVEISALQQPTLLLQPLDNNKTNAQYLFSEKAVKFTLSTIKRLGFSRILCIGAPRLHEALQLEERDEEASTIKSLLLDIDHRMGQFFPPKTCCRFNMFNHHFFEGLEAEHTYRRFIKGPGLCVVMDPPFGGLVAVLAQTLHTIEQQWREASQQGAEIRLPVLLFFPYFMEARILEHLPHYSMLDYKVDYTNHASFKSKKSSGSKKSSPVRIFTSLSPSDVPLPADDGYRLCLPCERWVAQENRHCDKCNACTSKDGRGYVHCDACGRCVKRSYEHCDTCRQCLLPTHTCGQATGSGCYICGDQSHKKRDCPQKPDTTNVKRKGPWLKKGGKKKKLKKR